MTALQAFVLVEGAPAKDVIQAFSLGVAAFLASYARFWLGGHQFLAYVQRLRERVVEHYGSSRVRFVEVVQRFLFLVQASALTAMAFYAAQPRRVAAIYLTLLSVNIAWLLFSVLVAVRDAERLQEAQRNGRIGVFFSDYDSKVMNQLTITAVLWSLNNLSFMLVGIWLWGIPVDGMVAPAMVAGVILANSFVDYMVTRGVYRRAMRSVLHAG